MKDIFLIIFGMAAVTYGPRVTPFLLLKNRAIPERFDAFLQCIPAAALGALIVPGVFHSTPGMPMAAIIGIGFTIVYGSLKGGFIIPVLGSVAATYLLLLLGG